MALENWECLRHRGSPARSSCRSPLAYKNRLKNELRRVKPKLPKHRTELLSIQATMATVASPATPKWKGRFKRRYSKGNMQIETPKEADNGLGRSLSAARKEKKKGGGSLIKRLFSPRDGDENHPPNDSLAHPASPSSLASVEVNIRIDLLDRSIQSFFCVCVKISFVLS